MHEMNSTQSSPIGGNVTGITMLPMNGHANMSGHGHLVTHNMDDASHGMNDHMPSSHQSGGHSMYFSFSLPVRVLFFEWNILNQGHLASSCVGVFLFAVLYEGLKVLRQYLLRKTKAIPSEGKHKVSNDSEFGMIEKRSAIYRIVNGWHLLQSLLQVLQTTMGMLLMLIYMTFNIWLGVAVSLGSGAGYLLFAWTMPIDMNFGDHCE